MEKSRKRFRRILAWTIGVIAVAGVVYLAQPKPLPVDLGVVERHAVRRVLRADGVSEVLERFRVSAPVSGLLRRTELEVGQQVAEGEVLFVLDSLPSQPLDARSRSEMQARVRSAQSALAQAQGALPAAEAALRFAQIEAARVGDLVRAGGATEQQRDRANFEVTSRQEASQAARLQVDVAASQVAVARSSLTGGQTGGGVFEVRSPAAGRILALHAPDATVVTAGAVLAEVGDPRQLQVRIELLSADAARLAEIAARNEVTANIAYWGGDDLQARLLRVDPVGVERTSALGVSERRVATIFAISSPIPPALADGYRVEAEIELWNQPDALAVPISALTQSEGKSFVFVVKNGVARRREVTTTDQSDFEAVVTNGVEEGELVVTHPPESLDDGIAIVNRDDTSR